MDKEDTKFCWKCQRDLPENYFTLSRWESEANTTLCAICARNLQKERYKSDNEYRESKKNNFKDNYDKEKERERKQRYRKKLKEGNK